MREPAVITAEIEPEPTLRAFLVLHFLLFFPSG
jgi:hypothetical protein